MSLQEITAAVSKASGIRAADTKDVLDKLFDHLKEQLLLGESVHLPGIGTISHKIREERMGMNLQTKKKIKIPRQTVLSFKPFPKMKEAVKELND